MSLILLQGELLAMQADAVVNPACRRLQRTRGICGDIFDHAGSGQLHDACRKIGYCDVGDAVITPGFGLHTPFIIHTVAPRWLGGRFSERKKLRSCYLRSLDLALGHDLHSVAFPLLSSALFPVPKKEAMKIAVSAIGDWLLEHDSDMEVYLLLHGAEAQEIQQQPNPHLQTYLDNQYIEKTLLDEFTPLPRACGKTSGTSVLRAASDEIDLEPISAAELQDALEDLEDLEDSDKTKQTVAEIDAAFERICSILDDAIDPSSAPVSSDTEKEDFELWEIDTAAHPPCYYESAQKRDLSLEDTLGHSPVFPSRGEYAASCPEDFSSDAQCDAWDGGAPFADALDDTADYEYDSDSDGDIIPMPIIRREPSPRRLEDLLDEVGESFSEMLFRLIDQQGMSDPEVYKRANMDRRLFSKIRSNPNYQPAKNTVFALAIALRLNLDQTTDLLCRAGFAFSPSSKSDVIIKYFIREGIFNIHEINEALFSYKQRLLGA